LHLPYVGRMRLGDIHHQKRNLIYILIVKFVEGRNLPPEGRSSVAAEDHHHRLRFVDLRKMHGVGFV
jgi:hypothetical protein